MPNTPREVATSWFEEVWNQRAAHLVPQLMSADAVGHVEGGEVVGPDGFFQLQNSILGALPDLKVKILRSVADGEDACILWEATGTHSGHGLGFAPTDQVVTFRGTTWFRVVDGQIVEGWDSWNQGALFAKLLAAPA